jgi:SAM-dependent methyltransferase
MVTCAVCGSPAEFMAKHPEADLYRCPACTHCFSDPASVEPQSYTADYFDEAHRRWFAHPDVALFDAISAGLPGRASVLDVGCGPGNFLRHLRRVRSDLELTGIDLAPNRETPGIRFYQGDFQTFPLDGPYDAVVSLAVIEHVADVRRFVERLHALTRTGGTATVMTLNESSLLYVLARAGKRLGVGLAFDRLYSRHHLHHFTRSSLRRLIESHGFRVEADMTHNAPLAAIDIPVSSRLADVVLRSGMFAVCQAGAAIGRAYLQTVTCRKTG